MGLMVLVRRSKMALRPLAFGVLAALALASLAYAMGFGADDLQALFYLPLTRSFELILGILAAIVLVGFNQAWDNVSAEIFNFSKINLRHPEKSPHGRSTSDCAPSSLRSSKNFLRSSEVVLRLERLPDRLAWLPHL